MSTPGTSQEIPARILLVDGDVAGALAFADQLAACLAVSPDLAFVRCGREAIEVLRGAAFDLLLVELDSLADLGTDDAMARLVRVAPGALVVALSDGSSISATLSAMSSGAHDLIARPVAAPVLATRLGELARRHGRTIAAAFAGEPEPLAGLVEASVQLKDVLDLVARGWTGSVEHLDGLASRVIDMSGTTMPDVATGKSRSGILPMWQQEQRIIEEAIASFGGNVALAAAALEVSPSTIYRKRQAWADMEGERGAA